MTTTCYAPIQGITLFTCIHRASLFHGTERTGPDRTQTLIHGTDRNGVKRMREAAGLLRLLSQPWLAQHESPVESLTT